MQHLILRSHHPYPWQEQGLSLLPLEFSPSQLNKHLAQEPLFLFRGDQSENSNNINKHFLSSNRVPNLSGPGRYSQRSLTHSQEEHSWVEGEAQECVLRGEGPDSLKPQAQSCLPSTNLCSLVDKRGPTSRMLPQFNSVLENEIKSLSQVYVQVTNTVF